MEDKLFTLFLPIKKIIIKAWAAGTLLFDEKLRKSAALFYWGVLGILQIFYSRDVLQKKVVVGCMRSNDSTVEDVRGGFNNKCEWSDISTTKKHSSKFKKAAQTTFISCAEKKSFVC
jgi:hypothetical protein